MQYNMTINHPLYITQTLSLRQIGTLQGKQGCRFHSCLTSSWGQLLTLLHSERPKLPTILLHTILAFLSEIELKPLIGNNLLSQEQILSFKSIPF